MKFGEDMYMVVVWECVMVCDSVGLFDVLMFGKIEVVGFDVVEFLEWMYINLWKKLVFGCCWYGFLFNDVGFIIDDGVIGCLVDDCFYVIIMIGGVLNVFVMMEDYL